MKRLFLSIVCLSGSAAAFSQPAETSFWDNPTDHPLLPVYLVIAFIIIITALLVIIAIYLITVLKMFTVQAEKEKARHLGKTYVPQPSWWARLTQQLNASVPVAEEKNIELDHNYDGIKELDNYLPPWWKWLFYGTIAWSVVYVFVFHLSESLPLSIQEYQNEIAQAEEQQRLLKASQPEAKIDENTLVFTNDPAMIEKGKTIFMNNNCGSCHRNDGGGNTIGPNLTDDYWIHGGDLKNVFVTIKNGAVEKGMPAWGKSMKPEDVRDVTFFVISLKGTNPENAKAPQGELYQEPAVQDSVNVSASLQRDKN
jgi:cytochrome c oxidase cbb3-type subunit III